MGTEVMLGGEGRRVELWKGDGKEGRASRQKKGQEENKDTDGTKESKV